MAERLDGWSDWGPQIDWSVAHIRRTCAGSVRCDSVPMAAYGRARATDLSYSVGNVMFYILYQVLGADTFDRAYRTFFQRYRTRGARTTDLVAAFHDADARSDAVLDDWLLTTRWYGRLSAGTSIDQMIGAYRSGH
jgi:hypothetical protein